ncbi:YggT family protein [Flocculibacter collagenilyticus]|uniref:YggT family protein n=1 Tax=Flocculibacter collagenilyticus TaxID=2744479 RepID=UPI0018F27ED7|nr:YggT family protein [Flocculibacter collagenilyticus]
MNAIRFLIDIVFDLYLMVVMLRFWLQLVRADFYNPFSQFIVKATNIFIIPLRKVIPGFGGMDIASVVLMFIVAAAKIIVLSLIFAPSLNPVAIAIGALLVIIKEAFNLVFWVVIIRALMSWVSQGHNPIEMVLHQLTEPLLRPIRKVIPPMGGLDLSVMVFLLALMFFKILMEDLFRGFF